MSSSPLERSSPDDNVDEIYEALLGTIPFHNCIISSLPFLSLSPNLFNSSPYQIELECKKKQFSIGKYIFGNGNVTPYIFLVRPSLCLSIAHSDFSHFMSLSRDFSLTHNCKKEREECEGEEMESFGSVGSHLPPQIYKIHTGIHQIKKQKINQKNAKIH